MAKYDYSWRDLVNLDDAIYFYAQQMAFGHRKSEIAGMLKEIFPGIDPFAVQMIRTKAKKLLRQKAKELSFDLDVEMIFAKLRAEKLVRSRNENIAVRANEQLIDLMNLRDHTDRVGSDVISAEIRADISGMDASVHGAQKTPAMPESTQDVKTQNIPANDDERDFTPDEEKIVDQQLKIAATHKLKADIENERKDQTAWGLIKLQ